MTLSAKIGRIIVARLPTGEDLLDEILKVVNEAEVSGGCLMLIGALSKAAFGIYVEGKYKVIELQGPLEILSCIGNIAESNGEKIVHAHITVSDAQGKAYGGHLLNGCIIDPTAELVIIEGENLKLQRKLDKETGLKLLST
ncbi:MAG: DNA-binding protein [Candidatus Methanomethylicota archaeon]|uniref:DNA-binding protein n=1 Tax=Thermoproteota archaeon TaxID=2056631 RepID=A0A497EX22_9CREN|nr:MAG: DNA-binding protein [Candidatus Verstraetearchaeota archaeon]